MAVIEAAFPEVHRFELFTGQKSARNIYLYQKLNDHMFKEETLNAGVMLVYLEKIK